MVSVDTLIGIRCFYLSRTFQFCYSPHGDKQVLLMSIPVNAVTCARKMKGVEVVNADVLVTLVNPRQQLRSTDPLAPSSMWSFPCSVRSNDMAHSSSST